MINKCANMKVRCLYLVLHLYVSTAFSSALFSSSFYSNNILPLLHASRYFISGRRLPQACHFPFQKPNTNKTNGFVFLWQWINVVFIMMFIFHANAFKKLLFLALWLINSTGSLKLITIGERSQQFRSETSVYFNKSRNIVLLLT